MLAGQRCCLDWCVPFVLFSLLFILGFFVFSFLSLRFRLFYVSFDWCFSFCVLDRKKGCQLGLSVTGSKPLNIACWESVMT